MDLRQGKIEDTLSVNSCCHNKEYKNYTITHKHSHVQFRMYVYVYIYKNNISVLRMSSPVTSHACMLDHTHTKHSTVVVGVWQQLTSVLVFVQIFPRQNSFFFFPLAFFPDLLFLFFPGDDDDVHYLSYITEEKYSCNSVEYEIGRGKKRS